MPAGPFSNATIQSDGTTPLYDTGANWAPIQYDWDNGYWSAAAKQQQWWLGRRPPDDAMVSLYQNTQWNAASSPPIQPYQIPFYMFTGPAAAVDRTWPRPDAHNQKPLASRPTSFSHINYPAHAPAAYRGQDLNPRIYNEQEYWSYAGWEACYMDDQLCPEHQDFTYQTYGAKICSTTFQPHNCSDNMFTLTMAGDAHLDIPQSASLFESGRPVWHWGDETVPSQASSDKTCNLYLQDLVPGGSSIEWVWNSVKCAATMRWAPFSLTGPVPNAVYPLYTPNGVLAKPKNILDSGQAVELLVLGGQHSMLEAFSRKAATNGVHTRGFPESQVPLYYLYFTTPYDVGFSHDHYGDRDAHYLSSETSSGLLDISSSSDYSSYRDTYLDSFLFAFPDKCDGPFNDGDVCTLSLSPQSAPGDVCGSVPQGLPVITCRTSTGQVMSINSKAKIVVRYKASAKYEADPSLHTWLTSSMEPPPTGLLPRVPCNRATYSPRFGGRCAAPVVQYLAYDEAYFTRHAQDAYGFPEYGGCLAGGVMRYLAAEAANGSTTNWDNAAVRSWFTPPMWPYEAWRAAPHNADSASVSFYSYLYTNSANATNELNTDQQKLDRLFVWQDVFKLPTGKGPAGKPGKP